MAACVAVRRIVMSAGIGYRDGGDASAALIDLYDANRGRRPEEAAVRREAFAALLAIGPVREHAGAVEATLWSSEESSAPDEEHDVSRAMLQRWFLPPSGAGHERTVGREVLADAACRRIASATLAGATSGERPQDVAVLARSIEVLALVDPRSAMHEAMELLAMSDDATVTAAAAAAVTIVSVALDRPQIGVVAGAVAAAADRWRVGGVDHLVEGDLQPAPGGAAAEAIEALQRAQAALSAIAPGVASRRRRPVVASPEPFPWVAPAGDAVECEPEVERDATAEVDDLFGVDVAGPTDVFAIAMDVWFSARQAIPPHEVAGMLRGIPPENRDHARAVVGSSFDRLVDRLRRVQAEDVHLAQARAARVLSAMVVLDVEDAVERAVRCFEDRRCVGLEPAATHALAMAVEIDGARSVRARLPRLQAAARARLAGRSPGVASLDVRSGEVLERLVERALDGAAGHANALSQERHEPTGSGAPDGSSVPPGRRPRAARPIRTGRPSGADGSLW